METNQITLIATIFSIVALSSALHGGIRKTKLSWFVYSGGATIICTISPFAYQALYLSRWGWDDVLDPYAYEIVPNFFLGPVGLLVALALANRFLPNFRAGEGLYIFQLSGIQSILYWIFCVVFFYVPMVIYLYGIVLAIISPMGFVALLIGTRSDPFRWRTPYRTDYEDW